MRYDEPLSQHLSDAVIKPRMAARGVRVTDEAAFRGATGAASAADLSAQANSTILRFQSEGINRVVLEPMRIPELREVVTGPAKMARLSIEPHSPVGVEGVPSRLVTSAGPRHFSPH